MYIRDDWSGVSTSRDVNFRRNVSMGDVMVAQVHMYLSYKGFVCRSLIAWSSSLKIWDISSSWKRLKSGQHARWVAIWMVAWETEYSWEAGCRYPMRISAANRSSVCIEEGYTITCKSTEGAPRGSSCEGGKRGTQALSFRQVPRHLCGDKCTCSSKFQPSIRLTPSRYSTRQIPE